MPRHRHASAKETTVMEVLLSATRTTATSVHQANAQHHPREYSRKTCQERSGENSLELVEESRRLSRGAEPILARRGGWKKQAHTGGTAERTTSESGREPSWEQERRG